MFFPPDYQVIQQHHGAALTLRVHAQRCEVMWRDGTAVQLHHVTEGAGTGPSTFLRALQVDGQRWVVFDLRAALCAAAPDRGKTLEEDVLRLQPRDTQGVVFYSLRHAFTTSGVFVAAVLACASAAWCQAGCAQMAEAA